MATTLRNNNAEQGILVCSYYAPNKMIYSKFLLYYSNLEEYFISLFILLRRL